MKVIVTGGCGFIGSHLTDAWIAQGAEVLVIDNLSTGLRQNLNPQAQLLEKSLQDLSLEDLPQLQGARYIFHLGALASIVPSIKDPLDYFDSNVSGTVRLLELARRIDGLEKFVYAASGSCYGIPETYPTLEDAPIKPEYPYAFTKWQGEELVKHWGLVYNLPWLSLRLTNVFGPRSRTDTGYGAVFGVFLAQIANQQPLTIVGDGQQSRDFTYVSDVVQAFQLAAQSEVLAEIINIGSGNHYSINYLAELLKPVGTVHVPKRPGEPDITFVEIAKAQKLLGYHPQYSFEAGVQTMLNQIDFWREAPVWKPDSIQEATQDWFKYLSK
ncbi:NAD-dependent dehydratase [bacterium (Candidatus Blackallbacteria) CG17_big_fil_post_rev_8_21_14_2_50_48_46]|uniref:NAD-dependent dehydratase n=1 Tax=bacterium (Candidatus Blackallbacteria) CG17_big_fil_post_rev_8_21_14_2_50_48_46 TaxID=2014261 RepID=A0A2M7GA88_9BACT|nr:MAG: NAD-dependent dehydratase [bacterium (Candidatus Blackallbacteria) CG18_big_fil_WC_8_21_14_2_50_49_26]PIW19058.1 MAG: NAD-dependent dehydratase [bacterium (Candidatus Blackallbacteria) CG17_big_fil_post_rev_8_21_14_2_50_48_46]PIW44575.1 MAG: NAD-dependent dehydratase [bacterium (Candidatus Blackallbacteria) CG13_big_fil_rev_8_21_14_2_50_49_14]